MTVEAELADGTILEFPDGTTDQVVQDAIKKQIAAQQGTPPAPVPEEPGLIESGIEAAKGLGSNIQDIFTGESRQTRATETLPELGRGGLLSGLDKGKIAKVAPIILSTVDPIEISQILTNNFPEIGIQFDEKGNIIAGNNKTGAKVVINKPGFSQLDLVQTLGLASIFTPAARATTAITGALPRLGAAFTTGAATQAGLEGVQALAGSEQPLTGQTQEILLAGLGGAAAEIPAARRVAAQRQPDLPPVQQLAPTEEELIVQAGQREGVPVLTSDVFPPQDIVPGLLRQAGERIPFFGTGGIRATQAVNREEAVLEAFNSLPSVSDDQIIESLKKTAVKRKNAAGSRLQDVSNRMDQLGSVPTNNTMDAIEKSLSVLTKRGKIEDKTTIDKIQQLSNALFSTGALGLNQSGKMTPAIFPVKHKFSSLRSLRTSAREFAESADPVIRTQLPSFSKAQLQKIRFAMTDDLNDFVKLNEGDKGLGRYRAADLVYAEEAKKLTKSRLKNALDKADIEPEAVRTLLFNRNKSQVKLLHDNLNSEGKTAARVALVQQAILKAGGIHDVSPTRFANELKRLRTNTGVFFKGQELQRLNGLERLLIATKRASEAGVVTPTGQATQLGSAVLVGSQVGVLKSFFGAASLGVAARAYESRPMRDLLMRLSKAQRGGRAEQSILNIAVPAIEQLREQLQTQEQPE